MASYSYNPLPASPPSIRLLSIDKTSESPAWVLRVHSLEDVPPYDALSYVWGESGEGVPTSPITCSSGIIQIYDNLRRFLQQVTLRNHPRPIWTDAICINQGDGNEKDQQIPLMKKIYEGATNVIIWLGNARYLELQISPAIEQTIRGLRAAAPGRAIVPSWETLTELNLPLQRAVWMTFGDLLCNDWFKRLWCLQEVVLAESPIIWYGNETISWVSVRELSNELRAHDMSNAIRSTIEPPATPGEEDGLSAFIGIDICRDFIRRNPIDRVPVPTLLDLIRRKGAKNPSDKIFGILGLAHEGMISASQVRVEAPTTEIYTSFGKFFIQNDPSFSMFNHVGSINKMDGLPSWCPNFSSPTGEQSLGALQGVLGYRAGFSIRPVPNSSNISVPGCSIDLVDKVVLSSFHWEPASKDCMINNYIWEKQCLALSREVCQTTKTEIPEMHWRTLTADIGYSPTGEAQNAARMDRLEPYLQFQEQLEIGYTGRRTLGYRTIDGRDYGRSVETACTRRRFFSTKNGRLGLGPWDTKHGDMVCIFYTGPTPYLLRRDVVKGTFRLIGEAYVHGLMYGEGLHIRDESVQHQNFIIE